MTSRPSTTVQEPTDEAKAVARLAAQLRLAVARLARRLRHQDDSGVPHAMLSVLSTLQHGPMSLKELAAAEHVQPPSITPVVARLEESRLVTRTADATDRRVAR